MTKFQKFKIFIMTILIAGLWDEFCNVSSGI